VLSQLTISSSLVVVLADPQQVEEEVLVELSMEQQH
jgi:hypothetical protein